MVANLFGLLKSEMLQMTTMFMETDYVALERMFMLIWYRMKMV